jgi:lysophospholipid acyltransferase (LPLAT)-like uncharacterized protein
MPELSVIVAFPDVETFPLTQKTGFTGDGVVAAAVFIRILKVLGDDDKIILSLDGPKGDVNI